MTPTIRNAILSVGALGAIAVAAYRFMYVSQGTAQLPVHYALTGICLACKAPATRTENITDRPPLRCNKCGQQAVYPWYHCLNCGKRFIPKLERRNAGPPRIPMIPLCVACGSSATGVLQPGETGQDVVGEAPLPAWP